MDRNEFLTKLDEKVKSMAKLPLEGAYLDELKEKLIPTILEEFLESVPTTSRRGNNIKVESVGFKMERGLGDVYHILIDDTSIRIGNWWDGLGVLKNELVADLSRIVGKDVKATTDNNKLKFYFYY